MALIVLSSKILDAPIFIALSKFGGTATYSHKVALEGVGAVLKITLERSDNNEMMAIKYSDPLTGNFTFEGLAVVNHVLTVQDPNSTKLARSTTVLPEDENLG